MAPNIRRGIKSDAAHIADFQIAMALETENKTLERDTVLPAVTAVFADTAKGHYYVAEVDGVVVGCLMITFESVSYTHLTLPTIYSV